MSQVNITQIFRKVACEGPIFTVFWEIHGNMKKQYWDSISNRYLKVIFKIHKMDQHGVYIYQTLWETGKSLGTHDITPWSQSTENKEEKSTILKR